MGEIITKVKYLWKSSKYAHSECFVSTFKFLFYFNKNKNRAYIGYAMGGVYVVIGPINIYLYQLFPLDTSD